MRIADAIAEILHLPRVQKKFAKKHWYIENVSALFVCTKVLESFRGGGGASRRGCSARESRRTVKRDNPRRGIGASSAGNFVVGWRGVGGVGRWRSGICERRHIGWHVGPLVVGWELHGP